MKNSKFLFMYQHEKKKFNWFVFMILHDLCDDSVVFGLRTKLNLLINKFKTEQILKIKL